MAENTWICKYCQSEMAMTSTPAGEVVIECQNPACQWTIHPSCADLVEVAPAVEAPFFRLYDANYSQAIEAYGLYMAPFA